MRVRTVVSLGLLTVICSFLSLVVADGPSTAGTTTVRRPDHVPSAWQRSVTDRTSALQVAGGISLTTYLTGSATNGPVIGRVSDLTAAAAP